MLEIEGSEKCDSREKGREFVGKEVFWTSPGKNKKIISGKIVSPHGNKGVLRAIFEKGLPGQAIGTEVEIKEGRIKETSTKTMRSKKWLRLKI